MRESFVTVGAFSRFNKQASSGPAREETRKLETEKTSQLEIGLAETRKRERERREREREKERVKGGG